MKIGVIGAGKWGQALHFALSFENECFIASRTKKDIRNFVSLDEVLSCEYLVFALPAQVLRLWLKENYKGTHKGILVAAKGIEVKTGCFINEIFADFIDENNLAYLSGPSFAAEVMKKLPTALVISSKNEKLATFFKDLFPNFIKTYVSSDVIGAEVCGAYKNVLAIAGGICDGLELGNNARASLIARGLIEMARFGSHFGAKQETFLGLSGVGDLCLTASSKLSRNYSVGFSLSKGKNLENILEDLGEVAEGIATSKAISFLAQKNEIYTPIANEVDLIIKGKCPKQSLKDLLL